MRFGDKKVSVLFAVVFDINLFEECNFAKKNHTFHFANNN